MKRLYALTFCLLALAGTLSARCIEAVEAQELNLTPSPDSSYVAFTRGNDLWVRRTSDSLERRLTFDGGASTLNGYASWVYYEEILGRASQYKAFWWSPDSRRLAFYRFDESQVSVFPIFSPFGVNGSLRSTRYPKAGQSNPEVQIGIIDLQSPEANIVWAGFDPSEDQYFGTPFWSDDSAELYVSREPRLQNTLDLYAVSVADGSLRHVYHEEYPASWVEWIDGMLFTRKGLYMVRNFDLEITEDRGLRMMTIKGFLSYDEAHAYAQKLYADKQMSTLLKGIRSLIISEENLKLIGTEYSFDDYKEFYETHFAPMQVPEDLQIDEPTDLKIIDPDDVIEEEEEEGEETEDAGYDDFPYGF